MSQNFNSWYNRIFAAVYDPLLADVEKNVLQQYRRDLLGTLAGDVLELGCGTGANFAFYPQNVRLLALEPSDAMRRRASEKSKNAKAAIRIEPWLLESPELGKEFPKPAFDAAVCTLVLCTVPDPDATLGLLWQYLRPAAQLVVLEHVRAKSRCGQVLQNMATPLWCHLAEGCHLNRDTHAAIMRAGFVPITYTEFCYGLPFISALYQKRENAT
ncbi:MAG: class I SAM-dependent methyltransferase [Leptospiraceae bacterium]|nr:class I SAM-dependent methyltransferase [Leptospiraceae bacterium]